MSPRRARAVHGRVGDDPATALRQHLIETAEALLGERQLSTITTREIARAAGVSDGVLYNYFANKDELLLTALLRRFHPSTPSDDTGLPAAGSGSVEGNLCAYAVAALEVIAEALPMAAGLISEPTLFHQFMAAIHSEPLAPDNMPVNAYLRGEAELGRIREVDVVAASTLLLGSLFTLSIKGLLGGVPRAQLAEEIPGLVALLCSGLR